VQRWLTTRPTKTWRSVRPFAWRLACFSKRVSAPHQPNSSSAQDIRPERWLLFLAEFTRENRGAHGRVEILDPNGESRRLVPVENRPFDGVSADVKDRECTVWLSFGLTGSDRLAHGIAQATVIRALAPAGGRGAVLEIEAADGSKAICELQPPGSYELPAAEPRPEGR
jgi:hypothetical protein